MKLILSFFLTIHQSPIYFKVAIQDSFISNICWRRVQQWIHTNYDCLLYSLYTYLKKKLSMKVINYEILRCPTVSKVICDKSNALSKWTCQNTIYSWALLFNCYILKCHVTIILQTLIVLLLIQTHLLFRHILIHQWYILRTISQIIKYPIQLV